MTSEVIDTLTTGRHDDDARRLDIEIDGGRDGAAQSGHQHGARRPARSDPAPGGETTLAFRYLYLFRRLVVSLALVGAVLAWANQFPALTAALVCIGIGEFLESSYYITVLRWRQARGPRPGRCESRRAPLRHEGAMLLRSIAPC